MQASSAAIAHSIHVGLLLPGLIWMRGEDGPSAVIFQGRIQCPGWGIKDGKAPFGLTLQSTQMRCETDDPGRLYFQIVWRDYGCISHVPGPSVAPHTQPCTAAARRRLRPSKRPDGAPTCACTLGERETRKWHPTSFSRKKAKNG